MTPGTDEHEHSRPVGARRVHWLGLFLGPVLALFAYLWLSNWDAALTPAGRATVAVAVWMACWWLTEALPLAATALLPVAVFPLLGIAPVASTTAAYANSIIFLFMGGFILGLAMQRWGLHRRIALLTLAAVGTQPARLIAGFMLATAVLSMWISNTATVIMMLPIAASILEMFREHRSNMEEDTRTAQDAFEGFATALMLGIAYAASIGGMGTLIGTPPNLVLASFLEQHYGVEVTMLEWMRIGLPVVAVFLPITWLYLTRVAYPLRVAPTAGSRGLIGSELSRLGSLQRGEKLVLAVFTMAAAGWILRPQLVAWTGLTGISDTVIAIGAALILFLLPVDPRRRVFVMDWPTAKRLPWDILILFGGGLSLASAIAANGVDTWIASALGGLQGIAPLLAIAAVCALVVFLTEITSNTAVTATLLPVLAATALAADLPPDALLVTAALAASCAFMLPVATPPNAIVYSSGYVSVAQMARAGVWLNLMAIALISVFVHFGGCLLTLAAT